MRIEDVPLYAPCQPHWLCVPFMSIFTLLLLIGLVFFIRIVYREYQKIQRQKGAPSTSYSLPGSQRWWSANQYQVNLKRACRIRLGIFVPKLNYLHVSLTQ